MDLPHRAPQAADAKLTLLDEWSPGGALAANYPDISRAQVLGLRGAPIWWVTSDAAAAALDIAVGVPEDATAHPDLLPSAGLMFFERLPLWFEYQGTARGIPDTEIFTNAISWWHSERAQALLITEYLEGMGRRMVPFIGMWKFGRRLSDVQGQIRPWKMLLAVSALASTPRLAGSDQMQPIRAQRRRAHKAGVDLGATRVIYVRPHDDSSGGGAAIADRMYRHRWIVSGHWRSQPYGPGREYRRPVWIAPHVKGPDGAPLLHGEKVYAVTDQ